MTINCEQLRTLRKEDSRPETRVSGHPLAEKMMAGMLVPCGQCRPCLARRRSAAAGQAAMEGEYTLSEFGLGHVFFLTLTSAVENQARIKPRSWDLRQTWLPHLQPRRDADRFKLEGYEREQYQMWQLRERYQLSEEAIHDIKTGRYPEAVTLDKDRVRKVVHKARKDLGLKFRYVDAGEYGKAVDEHGASMHAHNHTLILGLGLEEFRQFAALWKHGHVDPSPHTREGLWKAEQQIRANRTPVRAAKYMMKYGMKSIESRFNTAAEFMRQHPYCMRNSHPALGWPYAEAKIVPSVKTRYRSRLDYYASEVSQPMAEVLAAYDTRRVCSFVNVAGQFFPNTVGFRNKLMSTLELSDATDAGLKKFSVHAKFDEYDEYQANEDLREKVDSMVEEAIDKANRLEKAYNEGQKEMSREWETQMAV